MTTSEPLGGLSCLSPTNHLFRRLCSCRRLRFLVGSPQTTGGTGATRSLSSLSATLHFPAHTLTPKGYSQKILSNVNLPCLPACLPATCMLHTQMDTTIKTRTRCHLPAFASVIVPSLSDAHSPPWRPHAHPVTPRRPTPQFTKTHHADHVSTHHPRKSFFRSRGPLSSADSYPLERTPVSELLSQGFTLCPPSSSQRPENTSNAERGRQVRGEKKERIKKRPGMERSRGEFGKEEKVLKHAA